MATNNEIRAMRSAVSARAVVKATLKNPVQNDDNPYTAREDQFRQEAEDRRKQETEEAEAAEAVENFKIFEKLVEFIRVRLNIQCGEIDPAIIEYFWDTFEKLIVFNNHFARCQSFEDLVLLAQTACKLFLKGSIYQRLRALDLNAIVEDIWESINQPELQSSENPFTKFRNVFKNYESLKGTELFKKLHKLFMYLLTSSMFEKAGLNMDSFNYTKHHQEYLKFEYRTGPDFYLFLLDTILFLSERGYEYYITGNITALLCSPSAYGDWFDNYNKLKQQSHHLNNPDPFKFTESSFLALLDDTIDKGHSILKRAYDMSNYDKRYISDKLNDLHLIRDDVYSKRHCREDRQPPFTILVSGDSGIGKSTIKDILFYFFANIQKLESDSSFRYTRNAAANFWDGFTTSQWCIVLDDIAAVHVTKAPNGDPSLMELLQIVNQIAFVPDQASLKDKGRTPMRPKLVIGTTNTENLNANAYFSCPSAVQRRFPYIVVPEVKDEYSNTSGMLDSHKVTSTSCYPDYWLWTVKHVNPSSGKARKNLAVTTTILYRVDIVTFLKWYRDAIDQHNEDQAKVSESIEHIKTMEFCECCRLPHTMCASPREEQPIQSTTIVLSPDVFYFKYAQAAATIYVIQLLVMHYLPAWFTIIFTLVIFWYFKRKYIRSCIHFINNHPKTFYLLDKVLGVKIVLETVTNREITLYQDPRDKRSYWEYLPTKMGIYRNKPIVLAALSTICTACIVLYKTYRSTYAVMQGGVLTKDRTVEDVSESSVVPTANDIEKENPWFNSQFNLSELPLSNHILCSKSMDFNSFIQKISRNCLYGKIIYADLKSSRPLRVTGICGVVYMTNNHTLPTEGQLLIEFISAPKSSGVTPNIRITINQSDILRCPEDDICFFKISTMPSRASLVEYFTDEHIKIRANAKMVARGNDGDITVTNIRCLTAYPQFSSSIHVGDMYGGRVEKPTANGECGSIVIMDTPQGRVITSMHMLGTCPQQLAKGIYTAHSNHVKKSHIERAIQHFRVESCGSEPLSLSSDSAPRSITELHFKSPLRYIENGVAEVYGSFTGFRRANKSSVCRTPMYPFLIERGYQEKYTKPIMSGYLPWRVALLDMIQPHSDVDNRIIKHCVSAFTKDIIKELSVQIKQDVKVYSDFTAINGAAGVTYVDLMKRSTSAGNPWKKKKIFFLEADTPQHGLTEPVKAVPEIMDRVRIIEKNYRNSLRVYPNFCAHLKDEAVTFSKRERGKTRVFTGAPMDFSIVNRKYFLSLIRLMQRNRFVFECGPGTISQSTEWDDIYNYLTEFGPETIVAGDYKSFDKHMHPEFMLGAFEILRNICEYSGNYDEGDSNALSAMAMDIIYPFVDYNGDLIQFVGVNPSGHPLTVIINGLVNCLYIRYVYAMMHPENTCWDFKNNVKLMTYGDDNIMGVNPATSWFNHTSIQSCLSTFGVTYTMADKVTKSIPFIHIKDASFLKRSWRYDSDVGYHLCPLEKESIERSLMIWVKSKTISSEEQCCEIITNSHEEYFWYGKKEFHKHSIMLHDLIHHLELDLWFEDRPLQTWDSLHARFRRVSGLEDETKTPQTLREEIVAKESQLQSQNCKTDAVSPNFIGHYNISLDEFELQSQDSHWEFARCTCKIQNGSCEHHPPGRSPKLLFRRVQADTQKYYNSHRNDLSCSFHQQIAQSTNINKSPVFTIEGSRSNKLEEQELSTSQKPLQSYDHQSSAASSTQQQNVGFSDDSGGMEMSMSDTTDYMSIDESTNISLGDFLSRPVNIYTYDWIEGTSPHVEFNPWQLYFSKGSIRRKLDHYYMLRCNLHLKFVINASPFYYGAMLASYRPLVNYNPANVDINPLAPRSVLVSRSQRPHVYLYPTNSQGGEMILPFISEKQWLNVTTQDDLINMGRLAFDGVTNLLNANSVTGSSATIQVFAWAENVKLAGPTVNFALQSVDEYCDNEGPVSGVASAVANYADKANDIADAAAGYTGGMSLMIKPFATATSLAAGAVSSVAKLFGYTNVPVIDNVHAFKPQPFPQFASPHIGTPVEKLTLDPKNELTIDPCVSGVNLEDELAISRIVQHESYLTQFDWSSARTENDRLFCAVVSPALLQKDNVVNNAIIAGTPLWYVSQAFSYWRGDITFRFKFLCSQYHRGRVRISWDPIGNVSSNSDPLTEAYTQIIDITKDTDVEFTVPYTQTLPFKEVREDNGERYSSAGPLNTDPIFDNGQLTVNVLTKQNSPVASADIVVAVFVKGTPSIEFAAPRKLNNLLSQYPVQAGDLEYDDPEIIDIGVGSTSDTSSMNLLYMGEKVHSLRELMRRSQYCYTISDVTQNINRSNLISNNRRLPILPGFDPNGISNAEGIFAPSDVFGYNFVNWTYLTWFSQAFVGNRGSIMWHANLDARQASGAISISRNEGSELTKEGYRTVVSTGDQDRSALSRYYVNSLPTGQAGLTLTNQHTQAGVSCQVPMYSQYKFLSNDADTRTLGDSDVDRTQRDSLIVTTSFMNDSDTTEDFNLHLYSCAGTDYNPVFFLNVPTFYEYPLQPFSSPL